MNVKDHYLNQLVMNVTNRCILDCSYCFTHQNEMDMSLDTAIAGIEYAWKHRAPPNTPSEKLKKMRSAINWFGGEPLLRYEEVIKPAMLYAEKRGYDFKWGISTNTILLNPERLEFFKHFDCGILYSIDGPEYIQNDQRPYHGGKPSWPDIEKNLDILSKYPGTTFRSTVTARNAHLVSQSYELARKYGFRRFYAGMDFTDPDWNTERITALSLEILKIATTYYYDVSFGKPDPTSPLQLVRAIKEEFVEHRSPENLQRRCGLGTSTLGMAPDGKFFACQEHSTYNDMSDVFYIGDIYNGIDEGRRQALLDLYNGAAHILENDPFCANCDLRGDCYAESCPSLMARSTVFGGRNPNYCAQRSCWASVARFIIAETLIKKNKIFIDYLDKVEVDS